MHAAAVALTHGWDPMVFLSLERTNAIIANAVLEDAAEHVAHHDKAMADYLADRIAGRINPVMVRNTTRLIRWLSKSLSSE